MDNVAQTIKNRLSLRHPQAKSLSILSQLIKELDVTKNPDLEVELCKVKNKYPTCVDFERDFVSLCFALATGVGKTRLMGAFITYLYLAQKIKNFFVLAPNLTIYNKLIEDFSNPDSPKYVFKGIGEYVTRHPHIITGDNYQTYYGYKKSMFDDDIRINIFNISKINAETRGDKEPRIKRLSEYIGDSYFNHLSTLDDLVLLMDESHHYRASRGIQVINELKPILGLELTATPQIERGSKSIKFKNVVFEYSLAKAIKDGFVKEPAVATRKDFDPKQHSEEELDRIKLEDGIRIHEDTKVALDIYHRDYGVNPVKPFVLVVAKDTTHAGKILNFITSNDFFKGYYANKVMEIHSNQRGDEKEENVEKLLSLEDPENNIEIVIHVNMLKEGWDVTNLYTIIPLRTAASLTLREQTVGRGLRLPYGKRTGVDKVDKLTVVAHDKFQEIIEQANNPDSIIRQENIIILDDEELGKKKEVITSVPKSKQELIDIQEKIDKSPNADKKEKAQVELEIHKAVLSTFPGLSSRVKSAKELTSPEIKQVAVEKIKRKFQAAPQKNLFTKEIINDIENSYNEIADSYIKSIIEIPRIVIQQSAEVKTGFKDFNLDKINLNFQPVSEEILIRKLREQRDSVDIIEGKGGFYPNEPDRLIVSELINFPEIDYDEHKDLICKLSRQAVTKIEDDFEDAMKIVNVVFYHKKEIAKIIYTQLMEHFYTESVTFEEPKVNVKSFIEIKEHNYSKFSNDSIHHYTETITPTQTIPSKIFSGFEKACHRIYKFDSKSEKDFSVILEQDPDVLKWLRPAINQFRIYWKHSSSQYHPDFVVETANTIFMVEVKKEADISSNEVKEKALAALEYCNHATDFTIKNGGKPWNYLLIPHSKITLNSSFVRLSKLYLYKNQ
jgi:type III restriction enzyme